MCLKAQTNTKSTSYVSWSKQFKAQKKCVCVCTAWYVIWSPIYRESLYESTEVSGAVAIWFRWLGAIRSLQESNMAVENLPLVSWFSQPQNTSIQFVWDFPMNSHPGPPRCASVAGSAVAPPIATSRVEAWEWICLKMNWAQNWWLIKPYPDVIIISHVFSCNLVVHSILGQTHEEFNHGVSCRKSPTIPFMQIHAWSSNMWIYPFPVGVDNLMAANLFVTSIVSDIYQPTMANMGFWRVTWLRRRF